MDIPIEILLHNTQKGKISILSIAFNNMPYKITSTEKIEAIEPDKVFYSLINDNKDREFIVYINLQENIWYLKSENNIESK